MKRVHNFNAGPAALPLSVLEQVRDELIDYNGQGLSVMEMSHRSDVFDKIIKDAERLTKEVMGIPDGYKVLFFQGGATLQFAAVPLNLAADGKNCDYINTGEWSTKAIDEAQKLGKSVRVIASSQDQTFSYIPTDFKINSDAAYLHVTSNNTIYGTQWKSFPKTGEVPLVVDMSSDINCCKLDMSQFDLVYAGAQKNMGPSGVTMVIIKEALLERSPANIPTMMSYKIIGKKDSLYNTPPTFGIYIIKLVLEWIQKNGGLEKLEAVNNKKADILYREIDRSDFYRGTVRKDSRSMMNVPFRLGSEELEKKFVAEAKAAEMIGLKGHRSVGGIRASIYNAVSLETVQALVDFMADFEKRNG